MAGRTEIRTDELGSYTAYIFDDGHVETDPPGRPLYRVDLQRKRRFEIQSSQTLKAASINVQASTPADSVLVSGEFYRVMCASERLLEAARMPVAMRQTLLSRCDLGFHRRSNDAGYIGSEV